MLKIIEKIRNGEPVKIAFFGDSITQGCFETKEENPNECYMDYEAVYSNRFYEMIMKKYPNANLEIINAGIGGNTAGMGLFRLEQDVLVKNPDFCVVCFGLNDATFALVDSKHGAMGEQLKMILPMLEPITESESMKLLKEEKPVEAFAYAMKTIFKSLEEAGVETVYMTPNTMNNKPAENLPDAMRELSKSTAYITNKGIMDEVIEEGKKVAFECGITVIDCYKKWKEMEQKGIDINKLLCNGINHPTRESHQLFADELFQTIVQD